MAPRLVTLQDIDPWVGVTVHIAHTSNSYKLNDLTNLVIINYDLSYIGSSTSTPVLPASSLVRTIGYSCDVNITL
jgi:hypothetical protein